LQLRVADPVGYEPWHEETATSSSRHGKIKLSKAVSLRACLAEFLLRRQPLMGVPAVKRDSYDFGCLAVVERCMRTANLRSWKAGAFARLD
jgi:hypothetical protein